ncbi:MAG TPA: hypothetical protein VK923_13825 [Euzebyales bacterium]|nr:hypothetical protein [Euzebyales bacterium]
MRRRHPEYAAPDVYMMSYGRELNCRPPLLDTHRRIDAIPYPGAYGTGWWGPVGPHRQMVGLQR